jgi:hypothetical protein
MAEPRNTLQNQASVGRNEQARRRRQRARRRGRNNNNGNNFPDLPPRAPNNNRRARRYRRNVEEENKEEEKETVTGTWQERLKVTEILSPALISFCEAVVHPFGNSAIGATLPDKFQELVIPLTDRMEFDIAPSFFNVSGTPNPTEYQLTGIFCWFMPRCLGAGTTSVSNNASEIAFQLYPYLGIKSNFSTQNMEVIHQQYVLCLTGIWRSSLEIPVSYGFYNDGLAGNTDIQNYYAAIEYSRFVNINQNCDGLRILGAGIKMWSEEAPINTGGYSVGGWATLQDILAAQQNTFFSGEQVLVRAKFPGQLAAFQTNIKFACRTQGVKGSTVRYSPLQTPEQCESEYPWIPDGTSTPFKDNNYRDIGDGTPAVPFDPPVSLDGVSLAIHDVMTPGSYVPCIFWSFNTNLTTDIAETYTIKLMSMVHSEGTPKGSSPFMSDKSNVDLATTHVKSILENPEVFPPATGGSSFKSFMSKVRHIIAKVTKGAGHVTKVLAMADSMAEKLG